MGKVKLKDKVFMLENIPKKKCRYCLSRENLTYDHKFPLILGGTSELKNIQVLCESCNKLKSNLPDGRLKNIIKWAKGLEAKRLENKAKRRLEE